MVCATLDTALRRLAEESGCTYTRYADDITFSTTRRRFPEAIAVVTSGSDGARNVRAGDNLRTVIEQNSFKINFGKVRLRNIGERREVTSVNVPREYIKNVRGMLHSWERFGYDAAESELRLRHYRKHRRPSAPAVRLVDVVSGKLEFLRMVKGIADPVYTRLWNRFATTWSVATTRRSICSVPSRDGAGPSKRRGCELVPAHIGKRNYVAAETYEAVLRAEGDALAQQPRHAVPGTSRAPRGRQEAPPAVAGAGAGSAGGRRRCGACWGR
jgi:hypothetical protein